MSLELGTFPVQEVQFGSRNRWHEGRLEVSRGELVELVRSESRITDAKTELASPGESTRITHVRDVVESRIKVRGPGAVYPGVCGRPMMVVGEGRTRRLAGLSVVVVSEVPYWRGAHGKTR